MISKNIHFSDLIPDYHHGVIEPELKNLFEKELSQNSELQLELDEFRKFEELYKKIDCDVPEPPVGLFDKIMTSIDNAEEIASVNKSSESRFEQTEYRPSLAVRLEEMWVWLKESVSIPWGLAAVQAIALALLLMPAPSQDNFQTLSSSSSLQTSNQGARYNIVFNPSATESNIRELLLSVEGDIVSGPSAKGRYVITLSEEMKSEQKINNLKQANIVLFIEKSY